MSQIGMTQVVLAEKLGCTQQHISMLLKGKNNLTLETIAKLEEALEFNIIGETLIPNDGHSEWAVQSHHAYLSDTDQASYGENE